MDIGEFARRSRLSAKALRLYDDLDLLPPAQVDESTGYRCYEANQIERARLIAAMRQLLIPLAAIKEMLDLDPTDVADRIGSFWRDAEEQHTARRDLASHLVNRLNGKRSLMYEVSTRELPERSLLCLKRSVDEPGAWALGKEFIAILRERPLPLIEGRVGAAFCIYWGEVSADSDGPVEWCKPVPEAEAESLSARYPELSLRTEPAHSEAYVALAAGLQGNPTGIELASEALGAWAEEQGIRPDDLALKPEDLGVRITYLASRPATETSVPDCDFAVPFG